MIETIRKSIFEVTYLKYLLLIFSIYFIKLLKKQKQQKIQIITKVFINYVLFYKAD